MVRHWTIKKAIDWAFQYLESRRIESPHLNAELLVSHVLGKTRLKLYLEREYLLSPRELSFLKKLVVQRSRHIPLAYLTEEQDFMGIKFKVSSDVHIPRPETEILVEASLEAIKEMVPPVKSEGTWDDLIIIDLGTGCGNIAIKLAKELEKSKVYAVDISSKALEVAQWNAKFHNLDNKISFLRGDLFLPLAHLELEGKVNLIISNPPYVSSEEMNNLPLEVKREPRVALEGGENGLNAYRRIISQSVSFLRKAGFLALEIGYKQAGAVRGLITAQEELSTPQVILDYGGNERVILVKKDSVERLADSENKKQKK